MKLSLRETDDQGCRGGSVVKSRETDDVIINVEAEIVPGLLRATGYLRNMERTG